MQIRAVAAVASLAFASLAQAAAPPAPIKAPEIKYETYTLPNGLKVITHEDHRLPLVAVDLWYHVGPLNERAGRTGFAHLFEHMMFEGSEHVGEKAHIKYVQGAGATERQRNYLLLTARITSRPCPPTSSNWAFGWRADRMGFLMEGLDRKSSSPISAMSSATSAARARAGLTT